MIIKVRMSVTVEVDTGSYEMAYGVERGTTRESQRVFRKDVQEYVRGLVAEGAASDSGIMSATVTAP